VGLLGERDTLLDRGTGIGGSKANLAKTHGRELVAGGEHAVRAGLQIAAVDGQHLLRLGAQHFAGPERACEIAAGALKFRGKAAVEHT
jgi:hypothetical protein